jgi:hypothetical protein
MESQAGQIGEPGAALSVIERTSPGSAGCLCAAKKPGLKSEPGGPGAMTGPYQRIFPKAGPDPARKGPAPDEQSYCDDPGQGYGGQFADRDPAGVQLFI